MLLPEVTLLAKLSHSSFQCNVVITPVDMGGGLVENIPREHEGRLVRIGQKGMVVGKDLGALVSLGMMTITELELLLCSKWLIRNLVGCNSVSEG